MSHKIEQHVGPSQKISCPGFLLNSQTHFSSIVFNEYVRVQQHLIRTIYYGTVTSDSCGFLETCCKYMCSQVNTTAEENENNSAIRQQVSSWDIIKPC